MPKPTTLPDPHGVVHEVMYLDAIWWRPDCSLVPFTKPKGWKKMGDLHVTCLLCLVGVPEKWFAV